MCVSHKILLSSARWFDIHVVKCVVAICIGLHGKLGQTEDFLHFIYHVLPQLKNKEIAITQRCKVQVPRRT